MMLLLEDDSSVNKTLPWKHGLACGFWEGTFYTIFRELSLKDSGGFCEYMKTPYAKFKLINYYTFSRRHVEFWAQVKDSKGIVDENIG